MVSPINILFIDSVHPLLQKELEARGFICHLQYEWSRGKIGEELHKFDGVVIRSRIKLDKELIDKGTNLKFIARAGAGMENIDVTYAESKGIKCLPSAEGNRDAVGEHALGMLLCLFNNICRADREVREGLWVREGNRGVELQGKTVGIIGYGNMGSAFAQRLRGFDCTVLAYDKYKKNYSNEFVKETNLDELYEKTDVLSIHLPLTEETIGIVNRTFLEKFKKSIYFINTSRGKQVVTDDLVACMKSGKVIGACIDVIEYESLSFEGLDKNKLPESFHYLAKSDRVVLTPHIAGWTHESNEKISATLARKILALFGMSF
ncbi:MAG TPA: 2-hydroxyacid dehydrogenase [Bacteroidia bacterium]|jgi:D-3-phosphoglycerate dehydrogenase|nr:2-hydroxyacid dehydrogenase [Bacteroidia bacterium]